MTNAVKGIPEGASVIILRLFCRDVVAEIDFCVNTFGAVERVPSGPRPARSTCDADHRPSDDHDRVRMVRAAKPSSCFGRQLAGGDLRLC